MRVGKEREMRVFKRVEREILKRELDKKVREESWTKELYLFSLKSLIFVG